MDDLYRKRILAEIENVEISLHNLSAAKQRENKSIIELAAMATFLHNIYNGIENILKQCLKKIEIKIPNSVNWHKDLLNSAVLNNVISEDLSDVLYEYLTFRHFFIHSYGFMLQESSLADLAGSIPEVWLQLIAEIEKFLNN